MTFQVRPISETTVAEARRRRDARDPTVIGRVADEALGFPCRRCLRDAQIGDRLLLFAHRPFDHPGPYAETGPVFVHEDDCPAAALPPGVLPEMTLLREQIVVRAYDGQDWIHSGHLVPTHRAADEITALFADPSVAYAHARSVTSGCFTYRLDRA